MCELPRFAERWMRAHNDFDTEALALALHDEVTVDSLFRAEPARGKDAAIAHYEGMIHAFPDLAIRVGTSAVSPDGKVVFFDVKFIGTFKGELRLDRRAYSGRGQTFEVEGVVHLGAHNNSVRLVRTFFKPAAWFNQIGIPVPVQA